MVALAVQSHQTTQYRRGDRANDFWPRPWVDDAPPDNDTVWVTEDAFGLLRGTYRDGCGLAIREPREGRRPERDDFEIDVTVTHTRSVLFLKPDYWIIVDALAASDDVEHSYEFLFHLDADEAVSTLR